MFAVFKNLLDSARHIMQFLDKRLQQPHFAADHDSFVKGGALSAVRAQCKHLGVLPY